MNPRLPELVTSSRILVCCGAGGVGKTTTAASLGLAGARAGRRVLVLTIDPSKRLAEALGVSADHPEPQPLSAASAQAAGITAPGALDVWMLDPQHVANDAVRRLTRTDEEAALLLENRIYQNVASMVAGMQEYTAMEALYAFVKAERYDLVVLDTPPSRNALNFLEGPSRLLRFFDGRLFQMFLPKKESALRQAAGKLAARAFGAVFGESFYGELQQFLSVFASIFHALTINAGQMREELSKPDSAFLLVTSPAQEALTEALFFREKTRELGLPFRGFVLNRSHAREADLAMPTADMMGAGGPDVVSSALAKLSRMAETEAHQARQDRALLRQLRDRAGEGALALALPNMSAGVDDIPGLVVLANSIME